jgi:hypothetical protein
VPLLPYFVAMGAFASALGGSTLTVNWPAAVEPDDVGLLVVENANQTAALTTPAGFVEITNSPQGTGAAGAVTAVRVSVFWCRATSQSPASPVLTNGGNHSVARIYVFRGCRKTGNPWNITAGDTAAAGTAVSIPGATTVVPNCLVLAIVANLTDTTVLQTSGFANTSLAGFAALDDVQDLVGNGGGFGIAVGNKPAAGAYSATTATLATSSEQGRISIALEGMTSPRSVGHSDGHVTGHLVGHA